MLTGLQDPFVKRKFRGRRGVCGDNRSLHANASDPQPRQRCRARERGTRAERHRERSRTSQAARHPENRSLTAEDCQERNSAGGLLEQTLLSYHGSLARFFKVFASYCDKCEAGAWTSPASGECIFPSLLHLRRWGSLSRKTKPTGTRCDSGGLPLVPVTLGLLQLPTRRLPRQALRS